MSASEFDQLSFGGWSESESLSIAGYNEPQLEGCYWYGQKRFDCILARAVFRASQELETIAGLDASLHDLASAFPYKSQLDLLRQTLSFAVSSNIVPRSKNARHAYLTIVGALSMRGEHEDRKSFVENLQKVAHSMLRDKTTGSDKKIDEEPDGEMKVDVGTGGSYTPPVSDDEVNSNKLRRASESLYQYGLSHEFTPDYADVPSDKPLVKTVSVTCGRRSFEAAARNKKLAKQKAAVRACEAMGIELAN